MTKEILRVKDLTKVYPGGVVANHNVNISIDEGEIHALIGENGAGKSTLMKMLFGMTLPTSGEIFVHGKKVSFTSSNDAIKSGIGMVHQHFMLVPSLTVAENLILGKEIQNGGFLKKEEAIRVTEEISKKYNLNVNANDKVEDISLAMKQKLEILKALYRGAKILILDEPTAVLTPQETDELFEQLKLLRENGYTIIFISHKLHEVKELCNRLTVLRDGKTMGTYSVSELSEQEISKLMVGRDVDLNIEKTPREFKDVVLSVKNLEYTNSFNKKVLDKVSFTVRQGQILGVAGIEGNGQSELISSIVGAINDIKGEINLKGKDISKLNILTRQEMGISHVSEDRMIYGSAPKLSIEDNAISKIYASKELNRKGLLDLKKVKSFTENLVKEFKVKHDNIKQSIKDLSGGNIQKVIVGREFLYNPKLLIVNQPTRGIDVGAIEFIRHKILEMRENKKAILLVSADLGEVLSLSDSIIIMSEGKIVGYIDDASNVTEEELGLYMLGIKKDSDEVIGGAYYDK